MTVKTVWDKRIMDMLYRHSPITLKVLTYYLCASKGKSDSHVIACVRSLRERKLVVASLYNPSEGVRSPQVLNWTAAGIRWLQPEPHPKRKGRSYRLGLADPSYQVARNTVGLHYWARGYREVAGEDVYEALRSQAVGIIRAGWNRDDKGLPLELLRKVAGYDLGMEAVVGPDGSVILMLPVYPGRSWKNALDRLTKTRDHKSRLKADPLKRTALLQVTAHAPLQIMVVCQETAVRYGAVKGIQRWSKANKIPALAFEPTIRQLAGLPPLSAHEGPFCEQTENLVNPGAPTW